MSFRDDEQLADVCNLLTARIRSKGIHWKGEGPDKGPSPAALEAIDAVEACALWARVLRGIRDVHSYSIGQDLEQSCSAVGFDGEDTLTLVLWCEDAATVERMERRYQGAELSEALLFHGIGSVRFTTEDRGPYLSPGELLMLRAAWAFWNGRGAPTLADLRGKLDGENLALIGSLLVALSSGNTLDVGLWLKDHEEGGPEDE